ncbi:MAG: hypothetical protein H0T82_11480, partial [Sphingomonas sp.]|nr:hypothetical protein [Sphingomonas sp.]
MIQGKSGAVTVPADSVKPAPYVHGSHTYEGSSQTAVTSAAADEPTTTISPGATVTAGVNTPGDVDLFNINLVAGQTYSFSLVGSGLNSLIDPILSLKFAGAEVANDDDGGIGTHSLLTFTATQSGTYQISAAAYPATGLTGQYTLAVRQMGADLVGGTIGAGVAIAADALTYGFVETSGDVDMYAVTLVEGMYYSFNLAGGIGYDTLDGPIPAGELDTVLTVYGPDGIVVAYNEDVTSVDLGSGVGFVASESGTYHIAVGAAPNHIGGYTLQTDSIDFANANPLDSIDWGTRLPSNTVTVYFATAGETFAGVTSLGWTAYEIEQAMEALQTFADVSNLTFLITNNAAAATFRLVTTQTDQPVGYFYAPGTINAGVGLFETDYVGWNTAGGLEPGGSGFAWLIHEFGHGLGLAHPHDNGGDSQTMLGVHSSQGSYGVFDLNQGVYTTMSYNLGWAMHPDGSSSGSLTFGRQAGPGALDIALIQEKYGASVHNAGDTIYTLPTTNAAGTFWSVIWDTGGTDTIVHSGLI